MDCRFHLSFFYLLFCHWLVLWAVCKLFKLQFQLFTECTLFIQVKFNVSYEASLKKWRKKMRKYEAVLKSKD